MIERRALTLRICLVVFAVLRAIRTRLSGNGISEYDWTTVVFCDDDGTELATARARIADTDAKHYVGLSHTESLDDNEEMLFVHPNGQPISYVTGETSFPLDIVLVDEDQTVTEIYHAE